MTQKTFTAIILILLLAYVPVKSQPGSDGNLVLGKGQVAYTDDSRARVEKVCGNILYLDPHHTHIPPKSGSFKAGDKLFIVQMEGGSPGTYLVLNLKNGSNRSIELESPVDLSSFSFDMGVVQVIRIPQWNVLDASQGSLLCHPYDGNTGGIMIYEAIEEKNPANYYSEPNVSIIPNPPLLLVNTTEDLKVSLNNNSNFDFLSEIGNSMPTYNCIRVKIDMLGSSGRLIMKYYTMK